MKIKSLLNLAEAKVYLDTVDFDSILLQDFLKKEKIDAKIYDSTGKHNEYPVIEYSGSKASLKKLIHEFFGDDDLNSAIEESKKKSLSEAVVELDCLDPEESTLINFLKRII